jgi:hypothetical protein
MERLFMNIQKIRKNIILLNYHFDRLVEYSYSVTISNL